MDVAINLRVAARDAREIDRLAALSGATRSDVLRAAIAAVIAQPELVTPPPLDEPSEHALVAADELLQAEARAVEREHFGF